MKRLTRFQRLAVKKFMEYLPLPEAIWRIRKLHPWWPEYSIRDAVRTGQVPHFKASLRPRAKMFVRLIDLELFVREHLTNKQQVERR